jgi:hypothetical protein
MADGMLGPMLMLSSLLLLNVPLVYLAQVAWSVSDHASALSDRLGLRPLSYKAA